MLGSTTNSKYTSVIGVEFRVTCKKISSCWKYRKLRGTLGWFNIRIIFCILSLILIYLKTNFGLIQLFLRIFISEESNSRMYKESFVFYEILTYYAFTVNSLCNSPYFADLNQQIHEFRQIRLFRNYFRITFRIPQASANAIGVSVVVPALVRFFSRA